MDKVTGHAELSDVQKNAINALVESYADVNAIHLIECHVNLDCTDEEETPGGLVSLHPVGAPVSPDSIREQMFQFVAVSKIRGKQDVDDAYFQAPERVAAFNEAVPQHSDRPARLATRDVNNNRDVEGWDAELGERDAFVGVYSNTLENGRDKDYYLVVRAGAPHACRDLKKELLRSEMTFKDLDADSRKAFVRYAAKRNALRLMYQASKALGLPINARFDRAAHTIGDQAHPSQAEPDYLQSASVIDHVVRDGRELVAVYNNVTPRSDYSGIRPDNLFFVVANPYDGIYAYPIQGRSEVLGIPADTGRAVQSVKQTMTPQECQKRGRGITWEGKRSESDSHPDLVPGAFNPVNDEFETAIEKAGWNRAHRRRHLVPVLLKIFNPETTK
jgi:hypothetical protein